MTNINKVMFCGRLARDPDLHETRTGTPVCNITLVQNPRVRGEDGRWEDGEPIFVDAAIWGKRAEVFAKHHRKGHLAYIEGVLRYDRWEDRETGEKRTKLKIDADSFEFMPGN